MEFSMASVHTFLCETKAALMITLLGLENTLNFPDSGVTPGSATLIFTEGKYFCNSDTTDI